MPHYTETEAYHEALENGSIDVSAHDGQAVFWSAYVNGNKERAEEFCNRGAESTTIEQTSGGNFLDKEDLFNSLEINDQAAQSVWDKASEKYAQSASNNCQTFVVGSDPNSTFRRVELPELVKNDKVTSINGISREELAQVHAKDPEAAFNRICEAELERDRARDQATPDFVDREAQYRKQLVDQGRNPDKSGEATRPLSKDERDARHAAVANEKKLHREAATDQPHKDDREP